MWLSTRQRFANAPTPMAGLALGIASLGWCWENLGVFNGHAQFMGALLAGLLLVILTSKFILHPQLLAQDLAHPVVGSVVPTFAMTTMVIAKAVGGQLSSGLWLLAIALHLWFLVTFAWHRFKHFELHHMLPSWFVPPIGIVVADVTSPGGVFESLAQGLLWFGLVCYAVMLPMMLYRLVFCPPLPDGAQATLAVMAAPGSLCLAGYLTVTPDPNLLLVAVLLGIAVVMTLIIYLAFIKLLRLPFSPGYAAFTFPLVIGAAALFKVARLARELGWDETSVSQLTWLAEGELIIATLIVSYVALRFALHFNPLRKALAELA
ncbi:TDT family transporter [Oceanisphaera avium]|uniref:C4-dicarboxylate ABC transporter n=1 Tax=Oceanisphaera avium TaxID=1903694 RepID=A0A1Y0CYW2_9GAMM|nr:TDT family transporter [Oceanisphaera avium]ART80489.1 C4-dicarboxylate ABC transporter [Oceanisphaera avium]